MTFTTTSGRFTVTSHGNGWAYEVRDNSDGECVWVQDDDADTMAAETDNFECEIAIEQYFGLE